MRFSKLALERYGRFEGCDLKFRETQPDLHVVYGQNEAGKTTSLAAVSDLLFGFQTKSPYNFVFDYPLLRIGAAIQEGNEILVCRRRKATSGTLVDANDRTIDETGLRAMLRGQTRDTFRLSFSLDQEALRRGGRAMVEAKNDVGQALFAAGSGLTGISDEMKRIENEADGIWGKRAKASRSYTQVERQLEISVREIRDAALKPKVWADTRREQEFAEAKLRELEAKRDELQSASRKAERIRRIAGSVRLREDLLGQIVAASGTTELATHLEASAESAMEDAEKAMRARSTAEKLLGELDERASHLISDPAVLEETIAIEQLILEFGAVSKASKDLASLEGEKSTNESELGRLRAKARIDVENTIASEKVATLRELARAHAADAAAFGQIAKSAEDLEDQRRPLAERINVVADDVGLEILIDAVDVGRRLGSDADDRCANARRQATVAFTAAETALARLKPWVGEAESLRDLPMLGPVEIVAAKQSWAEQRTAIEDEEEKALRFDEEKAKLQLQISTLSKGAAIPQEQLSVSRRERDDRWEPLKAHILSGRHLDDATGATTSFEEAMVAADGLSDRRFSQADASARLSNLETTMAERDLEAAQARSRIQLAKDRFSQMESQWGGRISSLGLVYLQPIQLETWLQGREEALKAQDERAGLETDAQQIEARRGNAVKALYAALGERVPAGNSEIAGILARAERSRLDREKNRELLHLDRQKLAQIEEGLIGLERRRASFNENAKRREIEWAKLLEGTGIVLDITTADAQLTLIDEVRQMEEKVAALSRRVDGIRRDAERFNTELRELSERLGMNVALGDQHLLHALRQRLDNGRSAKRLLDELALQRVNRHAEFDEASAEFDVAMQTITPLLLQTGAEDVGGLSVAINKSREIRQTRKTIDELEARIVRDGDGLHLSELVSMAVESDPSDVAVRTNTTARQLEELNTEISAAAKAHGDASRSFADLQAAPHSAADAASDAEQARSEMSVLAEAYILKRAQALTLRWTIERYREGHQNPLLSRASELFSVLTLGRYSSLQVEADEVAPRLLGIANDGRRVVDVGAMSEGTADQLFLALRLAAVEQSVAAGIKLPFLADDLFVNFDDERAEAGFRVLAELARRTQVLFFTHHLHLATIARKVVGDASYSECILA